MDNQIEVLWHETDGLGTLRSIGMDEYLYHPEEPGGTLNPLPQTTHMKLQMAKEQCKDLTRLDPFWTTQNNSEYAYWIILNHIHPILNHIHPCFHLRINVLHILAELQHYHFTFTPFWDTVVTLTALKPIIMSIIMSRHFLCVWKCGFFPMGNMSFTNGIKIPSGNLT